jgi:hypothetical protein
MLVPAKLPLCEHCGFIWLPEAFRQVFIAKFEARARGARQPHILSRGKLPAQCPKCHSPNWNTKPMWRWGEGKPKKPQPEMTPDQAFDILKKAREQQ